MGSSDAADPSPAAGDGLSGLTVLVTRPAHQAEPLCRLLAAHGAIPWPFPALAIHDRSAEITAEQRSRAAASDLLIFISPNALQFGLRALGGRLPAGAEIAVVGRGTARALEAATGRPADLCPQERFDSEGLLALPKLQQLTGRRVTIIRGCGGRELLADTLRRRGAEVDYLEVYRRTLPPEGERGVAPDFSVGAIDLITATSAEALANLFELIPAGQHAMMQECPLVVVNERMAEHARRLGFRGPLITAGSAQDGAMVAAIRHWRSGHNA